MKIKYDLKLNYSLPKEVLNLIFEQAVKIAAMSAQANIRSVVKTKRSVPASLKWYPKRGDKAAIKAKMKADTRRPLVRSGKLFTSLSPTRIKHKVSGNSVSIYSDVPYASLQQFGGVSTIEAMVDAGWEQKYGVIIPDGQKVNVAAKYFMRWGSREDKKLANFIRGIQ